MVVGEARRARGHAMRAHLAVEAGECFEGRGQAAGAAQRGHCEWTRDTAGRIAALTVCVCELPSPIHTRGSDIAQARVCVFTVVAVRVFVDLAGATGRRDLIEAKLAATGDARVTWRGAARAGQGRGCTGATAFTRGRPCPSGIIDRRHRAAARAPKCKASTTAVTQIGFIRHLASWNDKLILRAFREQNSQYPTEQHACRLRARSNS